MERLHGVDEHTRNLFRSPANDSKRCRVEVLEREAIVETALTAQPWLYPVPPAVIGPRKTHDQLPAGIKTCQPHGGHDSFGTTHMKGHFVHMRHGFEQSNVVGHQGMERAQHWTEVPHSFPALMHPLFVALKARHIDAV